MVENTFNAFRWASDPQPSWGYYSPMVTSLQLTAKIGNLTQ